MDMLHKVGASILAAEASWNPKTATESKERVMAHAAIEAMRETIGSMPRYGWAGAGEVGLIEDDDGEYIDRGELIAALSPRHDLDE